MEVDDEVVFFISKVASFEIGSQEKKMGTGSFGKSPPRTLAMAFDIASKAVVFFLGPCPFACMLFLTAWRSPHVLSY
ncbi:unnamed protein product [Cuscuta campestris]|uniref:Uncharacterized protein n=1 Tax=Cuscuta campestris TaxID=132261 RepID=A0A484KF91_9ASTE|nr:unnamed protein product [Cuscuta campestris]